MIFLTGATGFIGSHLLNSLSASHPVRCLVRDPSKIRHPSHGKVEVVVGNLLDSEKLIPALQGVKTIVHAGALIRGARSEMIWKVNVVGTQNLVTAAKANQVRHFIFLSTENVLFQDIRDSYAESKRCAEEIVKTYNGSLILRPSLVYGSRDTRGLARITRMLESSPLIPLLEGGEAVIQPIYVEDVVSYVAEAIQREIKGIFTLAGPDEVSIRELIQKICAIKHLRRVLFSAPSFLFWLPLWLLHQINPAGGVEPSQLINLKRSRLHDLKKTFEAFCHRPLPVDEGLDKWLSMSSPKGIFYPPSQKTSGLPEGFH